MQLQPLMPGNDYWALSLLIDERGQWESFVTPLTTKLRKVTVSFDELHIINDGAAGDTKAEFRIWIREGDRTVQEYAFPARCRQFPLSPTGPSPGEESHEHISLPAQGCHPHVIGLDIVIADTYDIGLLIDACLPCI